MKLNLGCGRHPMPGWVNIDIRDGPGVDYRIDLDKPNALQEFGTGEVTQVRALGIFEHLWHWEDLMLEIARVLKPGAGLVEIRVPYKNDYVAYHVRHFDMYTFDPFRSDFLRKGYDLRRHKPEFGSLEFGEPYFILANLWVEHFYPFAWHLAKYGLGDRAYKLPLGKAINLNVTLKRNERPWKA